MTEADLSYDHIGDDELIARQVELEQEMRSAGLARFRAQFDRAVKKDQVSTTAPGLRLVQGGIEAVIEGVREFLAEAETGRAGRRHTAVTYFKKLPPEVIADIALRRCIDSVMRRGRLSTQAASISRSIESEVNSRLFEEANKGAYNHFYDKAKTESSTRRRWSHLLFPARYLGVPMEEWDSRTHLLVGLKAIEIVVQKTGLVKVETVRVGKETHHELVATPETLAWIEAESAAFARFSPVLMPMLIQPKAWTDTQSGGYYTVRGRRLSLVKSRNRAYQAELADRPMPTLFAAVNALQNTPWSINRRILEVVDAVSGTGMPGVGVPSADPEPLPQKPMWLENREVEREDMTEEQREEFNAWRTEAQRVYEGNALRVAERAAYLRTVGVAKRFAEEPAIYFPHQLDWRGRAYPLPNYLSPQGSDLQRGLLQFADAMPISEQVDADWLAIHGAGCWGFDKVSLEERVAWVAQHQDRIVAAAADPLADLWWTEADKPWQFLAFCFDWSGFLTEGFGYCSALPVQMDGTCNGLQNFSAMLRDSVGGEAVNLVPMDRPQDIYQRVADLVSKAVEDDLFSGSEATARLARAWAGRIDRKVCKRPVMTLAYGAKQYGFMQQIDVDTVSVWRKEKEDYPFTYVGEDGKTVDFGSKAAAYLADKVWKAVAEVVVAARQAMDWLQEVAKIVTKEDLPISWETPSGFLVQQAYRVQQDRRIETTFNSTRMTLVLDDERKPAPLDRRRQASGISPNWVHSLDASHLSRTIERAAAEGVQHFSMIHDSYGTHAGNAAALAVFLREEFVRMYTEHDVLEEFRAALQAQVSAPLPACPAKGNLDLTAVLESPFFFA